MIKVERQDAVKRLLDAQGTVSVREISGALGVSEMTVRRDLEEMSTRGDVVRVHGGARSTASHRRNMLRREFSHSEKQGRYIAEKREIARRAVELIECDSTVFLGTGTTVEQMVPLLPSCHLRIVTNSLAVFNALEARSEFDLCLIGGMYRARTGAFVGALAEDAISSLGLDVAFIGANGISDNDISTSNVEEGTFQKLAFDKADARYLVADASKIGRRDFYTFYRLTDIDALICESGASEGSRAAVEEYTSIIC